MSRNRKYKAFNQHFFEEQLRDSRIGSLIVIVAFSIFLYADVSVYKYPPVIAEYRIALITYFVAIGLLSFRLKYYPDILRMMFKIGVAALMYFTIVFKIVITMYRPEYSGRAGQVYIMIMIGILIFAGLARTWLPWLLTSNIILYLVAEYLLKGFVMDGFYDYFNAFFMTVMAIVFNYLFKHSKFNEYSANLLMQHKIDELRNEILKRQVLENKLKEMATFDPMTSCYSRRAGLDLLKEMVELADGECRPLSICYLDIDNLKEVNDTYGHKMGDVYINEFVRTVKDNCRHTDFIIRLGGDEFLLVLPNTPVSAAEVVWLKIKSMMDDYSNRHHSKLRLGASHGMAEYFDSNYESIESFIDAADKKMYAEKKKSNKLRVR